MYEHLNGKVHVFGMFSGQFTQLVMFVLFVCFMTLPWFSNGWFQGFMVVSRAYSQVIRRLWFLVSLSDQKRCSDGNWGIRRNRGWWQIRHSLLNHGPLRFHFCKWSRHRLFRQQFVVSNKSSKMNLSPLKVKKTNYSNQFSSQQFFCGYLNFQGSVPHVCLRKKLLLFDFLPFFRWHLASLHGWTPITQDLLVLQEFCLL